MEYVVPIKRYTKKTPFCMYSNKLFLKYGLKDSYWVRHSVMKPFYTVEFQKRKETREGNNTKIENSEMNIFDKGALDKSLTVPEKTLEKTWEKFYEVIDYVYLKQSDVEFPNEFLLK